MQVRKPEYLNKDQRENKTTKEVMCSHCYYEWKTKSKMQYITCPNCRGKTKNISLEKKGSDWLSKNEKSFWLTVQMVTDNEASARALMLKTKDHSNQMKKRGIDQILECELKILSKPIDEIADLLEV